MAQSQNGCDRNAVLSRQPDLQVRTHTDQEIAKPSLRLGNQLVTSPSLQQETIELIKQVFRAPHFIRKPLSLCPPDSSLDGILVEAPKDLLQRRRQFEPVKTIGGGTPHLCIRVHSPRKWSNFHVPPMSTISLCPKPPRKYKPVVV